jgi:hypothetical protein
LIGTVLWDPTVPRSNNTVLVQLAQWGIFAFSAGAFWLTGHRFPQEKQLRRLTFFYLAVCGGVAIWWSASNGRGLVYYAVTLSLVRAPFWMLLCAMAGGQLLFNEKLSIYWRGFLVAVIAAVGYFCFFMQRERSSNWVGMATVMAMLAFLRWPRWRPVFLVGALVGVIFFFPRIYEFAGGDDKWTESGGSRLALIGRVVEVSMRNPITGLGPAAYRAYARMKPLRYEGMYWLVPIVNSHNNYVDLFSFVGLLGVGLFLWFVVEVARLGWRLHRRFRQGFAAGYINAVLAAGVGALVIMTLADWILPHVYNIGFPGFQASILVWLFMGGLLTFEQMAKRGLNG